MRHANGYAKGECRVAPQPTCLPRRAGPVVDVPVLLGFIASLLGVILGLARITWARAGHKGNEL